MSSLLSHLQPLLLYSEQLSHSPYSVLMCQVPTHTKLQPLQHYSGAIKIPTTAPPPFPLTVTVETTFDVPKLKIQESKFKIQNYHQSPLHLVFHLHNHLHIRNLSLHLFATSLHHPSCKYALHLYICTRKCRICHFIMSSALHPS